MVKTGKTKGKGKMKKYIYIVALLATLLPSSNLQAQAVNDCIDLIENGGFDEPGAWSESVTTTRPVAIATLDDGRKVARVGIMEQANIAARSGIEQLVEIPTTAITTTLTFSYRTSAALGEIDTTGDYATVAIKSYLGDLVATPIYLGSSEQWRDATINLTAFAGAHVVLEFAVGNDGGAQSAGMYLDDISVVSCFPPIAGGASPAESQTGKLSLEPLPTRSAHSEQVTPASASTTPIMSGFPLNRQGTIAVLIALLVVVFLLVTAIVRMLIAK